MIQIAAVQLFFHIQIQKEFDKKTENKKNFCNSDHFLFWKFFPKQFFPFYPFQMSTSIFLFLVIKLI